jgi:hypothetical protein
MQWRPLPLRLSAEPRSHFSLPQVAEADKLLSSLASGADADGDAALAPQLLRAQLALEDGDAAGALARLAALGGGLAAAPGVLATRVALLEQVIPLSRAVALGSHRFKPLALTAGAIVSLDSWRVAPARRPLSTTPWPPLSNPSLSNQH